VGHPAEVVSQVPKYRDLGHPESCGLREGGVEVVDGFVDFLGGFAAYGDAVDAGGLDGEAHGGLAVGLGVFKLASTDELHADDAHAFLLDLLDVGDDFVAMVGVVAVHVGVAVHAGAVVVDADERDLQPLVAGNLAEGGQAVAACAAGDDLFLRLEFLDPFLPALAARGPVGGGLPVEEHDVEVVGLEGFEHGVEALGGVAVVGGDLVHDDVALTRVGLEGFAEHGGGHVGFGGFIEADAALIGVSDETVEFLLAERGLHVAVVGAGAEGEARGFDVGAAEGDFIECGTGGDRCSGVKRGGRGGGNGAGGDAGFQKISAGIGIHWDLRGVRFM
jgi:hypothetical protein